jgi:hypothetical protein
MITNRLLRCSHNVRINAPLGIETNTVTITNSMEVISNKMENVTKTKACCIYLSFYMFGVCRNGKEKES